MGPDEIRRVVERRQILPAGVTGVALDRAVVGLDEFEDRPSIGPAIEAPDVADLIDERDDGGNEGAHSPITFAGP